MANGNSAVIRHPEHGGRTEVVEYFDARETSPETAP